MPILNEAIIRQILAAAGWTVGPVSSIATTRGTGIRVTAHLNGLMQTIYVSVREVKDATGAHIRCETRLNDRSVHYALSFDDRGVITLASV